MTAILVRQESLPRRLELSIWVGINLEERFGDEVLVTAPRTRKEGALVYCDKSKGDPVSGPD